MKRHKVITLIVGICLILVLVVTACAAPTPTPTPTPSPSPTATPTPTPSPSPTAEVFHAKFSSYAPRGVWAGDILYPAYCDRLEAMSNGRLDIEYTAADELVGSYDTIEALRTGLIDFGVPWAGHYFGTLPAAEVEQGLPLSLEKPYEQILLFRTKGWGEILDTEVYSPYGVKWIAEGISSGTPVISREPISSLDDFDGLQLRALGAMTDLFPKFDASIVVVPYTELYMALSLGTIDAAVGPWMSEYWDLKLYEFAKYILMPDILATGSSPYLVNMDFWNSLPDDLQQMFYAASWENSLLMLDLYDYDLECWVKMQAEGCSKTFLSTEDVIAFREVAVDLWDEIGAKDPVNAKMIAILKDYMTDLGYFG